MKENQHTTRVSAVKSNFCESLSSGTPFKSTERKATTAFRVNNNILNSAGQKQ